jgi:VacB/RNase II family 3'-5' exoribonuclease
MADRFDLHQLARRAMIARNLAPDYPPQVAAELATLAPARDPGVEDLRQLRWCSIDNDDSRDLDQLSAGAELPGGLLRIWVAVADVDAVVPRGGAIDRHAEHNTTSVYTAGGVFAMLPERLSTDITSLNQDAERIALIIRMDVNGDGAIVAEQVSRARVRNLAKLTYRGVGAWLAGSAGAPAPLAALPGLQADLRIQDQAAQRLRRQRHAHGALDLDTGEARPVIVAGEVVDVRTVERNRASDLIEDAMVAANGVVARFLGSCRYPVFRRVVRTPERWDRIVTLASGYGCTLPRQPDGKALADFLAMRQSADPLRFPDLSLAVVKLIGRGEYAVVDPQEAPGHFGLAVQDYAHSTAPNRRYPDLITQRLVKAALTGSACPYGNSELQGLAAHCTEQEDAASKVERQIRKSATALLLRNRIGDRFESLVTGASDKGTWVRTLVNPRAEGRVMRGAGGLEVGDRVVVRLASVDVERGFIDFERQ